MNVALLYGGRSSEHVVSIHSAMTIEKVLERLGYDIILISIDLSGIWHLEERPVREREEMNGEGKEVSVVPGKGFFADGKKLPIDVAFPVTHGHGGEDGCLQGLCALARIPYAGCDTLASSIMMFKSVSNLVAKAIGIPTIPTYTIESPTIERCIAEGDFTEQLQASIYACGKMLFVKPEDCGSSIGVTPLEDPDEESFAKAVLEARNHSERVLVQQYLKGAQEMECAVLEDERQGIVVSPPLCVQNPVVEERFLSYSTKYRTTGGDRLVPPTGMSKAQIEEMESYASNLFIAAKCHGYLRSDFFFHQDKIYFNEDNTLPGMTATSHYPVLIAQCGYTLDEAVEQMIREAFVLDGEEKGRAYQPPEGA